MAGALAVISGADLCRGRVTSRPSAALKQVSPRSDRREDSTEKSAPLSKCSVWRCPTHHLPAPRQHCIRLAGSLHCLLREAPASDFEKSRFETFFTYLVKLI